MPPAGGTIQLDGHSLSLESIEAAARRRTPVALTADAQQAVEASSRRVRELAVGERAVYGVNTGFGIFANRRIPPDELSALSRNLIVSHAVGVGDPFPRDVTRAAMVVRANTLALGLSGVAPSVFAALLELLNRGVTPAIPSQGSLGSSGDLAPLAHLALALTAPEFVPDAPAAWYGDERLPLRQALQRAGIEPVGLGPKDGLALTNGATFAAAILSLACLDLARTLAASEAAAALSLEALRAVSSAFDERLHAARPHPGQVRVARRIRQLNAGSRLLDSGDQVQDAYSLRCIPQVLGPVWEILEFARRVAEREVNSATDNPLLFDDAAISGGNFHGEPIGLASDYLKTAASEVGALSERRTFRLLSSHTSAGLPPMLVARPQQAGVQSGLMMLQYTAASLVLENQGLASPASVRSLPTSADQEDHNANATTAARELRRILENIEWIVAIELATAAQALDLRLRAEPTRSPGQGVQGIHAKIRERLPLVETDSVMTTQLQSLVELIRSDGWLPPES
jgi:histidine ammonia-lyase